SPLDAREEVVDERQLAEEAPDRASRHDRIRRRRRFLRMRVLDAAVIQTARDAGEALIEHRHEDAVDEDERAPEMQLPELLVQHPPGDLREPVVDAGE